jgi:excisionase family DNA binding protein
MKPRRKKKSANTGAIVVAAPASARADQWPEVLTLAEAAAYLRVAEAELERIVGTQGLPARRIGSEWRFSRTAIQDWLRRPSMKESLLRLAGSWKDDPTVDEMLAEIYRQRGRPSMEEAQ